MPDQQPQLSANGVALDLSADRFGELTPSDVDASDLTERFVEQGYLYLPGLLDPDTVMAARHEILLKFATIGEIDDRHPLDDAVAGSPEAVPHVNLRAFSESVRTGYWYTQVVLAQRLLETIGPLVGGEAQAYDFRWPRFVRPGEACGFHCDGPYMNRGTDKLLSSWIPLGSISPTEGALIILEDSHKNEDLLNGYLSMDADDDGLVWLDDDPTVVQKRYGRRWLTTSFAPGDVLLFAMQTLHGALDNQSPTGKCRLSSDSRYQLAGAPADPRWNGETILGHGGSRVFYPGLGRWNNDDFQDEWKYVDDRGRLASTLDFSTEVAATGTSPTERTQAAPETGADGAATGAAEQASTP